MSSYDARDADGASAPDDLVGPSRVMQVDDGAAHQFEWGSIQWLCSGQIFEDAQQTFGYVQILPGQKNPRHHHPNSDEMLIVIEGELSHSLGEEVYRLSAGMAIHIPQGVEHDATNHGVETARMIVSYPTSDRRVVMGEEGQE